MKAPTWVDQLSLTLGSSNEPHRPALHIGCTCNLELAALNILLDGVLDDMPEGYILCIPEELRQWQA